MRTDQDLHEAFHELAESAPHPGDVRATLQDRPRRSAYRRTALVIGTALATAAAATAAVVVPQVISSGAPVADQEKLPSAWSNWAGVPAIEGIDITTQTYTANRQDYELLLDYSPWVDACELQLRRNGDFDPKTVPAGSPTLKLGDRTAQVVTWPRDKPFPAAPHGYIMPMFAAVGKTLVWQPAKDVWGLLTCESQRHLGTLKVPTIDAPSDANTALAADLAVTLQSSSSVLRSPFRIGELPADLTARRVTFRPDRGGIDGDGNDLTVTLSDGSPATGYQQPAKKPTVSTVKGNKVNPRVEGGNPAYDLQTGDDLNIRYSTDKFWNSCTRMGTKPVATIHGMKAYFVLDQSSGPNAVDPAKGKDYVAERNVLRLEGNGVAVEIKSLGNQLTHDQLTRIAESIELTKNPNDTGSWFDAATAIR